MALPRYLASLVRKLAAAVGSCLAWVRSHREQVRVGLLAALITVCTAAVAYGALSLINRSSSNQASIVDGTQGWLGIEMASTTLGSNGFPTSRRSPGCSRCGGHRCRTLQVRLPRPALIPAMR